MVPVSEPLVLMFFAPCSIFIEQFCTRTFWKEQAYSIHFLKNLLQFFFCVKFIAIAVCNEITDEVLLGFIPALPVRGRAGKVLHKIVEDLFGGSIG